MKTNDRITISVVIPTLNEEKNIGRCLESVIRNKGNISIEIIVVDGGSTDNTLEIAKKFPVNILQNPIGDAESGKMVGLRKARGKFFMILDTDMQLVGPDWFSKMILPLKNNLDISGSWCGFKYNKSDKSLNRYITFDPVQRDPLFSYLTCPIEKCITKKNQDYWEMEYRKNRILPTGFMIWRIKDLQKQKIDKYPKYMELDILMQMVNSGNNKFAYVQKVGIYHPFLSDLPTAVKKRIRNLRSMYFNQSQKRYWTWIDWKSPIEIIKLFVWIVYVYTLIGSLIVGIIKSVKHKDLAGMWELPFNFIITTVVIVEFIRNIFILLLGKLSAINKRE